MLLLIFTTEKDADSRILLAPPLSSLARGGSSDVVSGVTLGGLISDEAATKVSAQIVATDLVRAPILRLASIRIH